MYHATLSPDAVRPSVGQLSPPAAKQQIPPKMGSIGRLLTPISLPEVPSTPPTTAEFSPAMESLPALLGAQTAGSDTGLETLRMQMFGRYYEELEGRMKELRAVVDGGVARTRRALMERVDELGSAMHRDMVALRQETNKDIEDLKRDVFTAVMSLSALNDKLGMADSRIRETYMALAKATTERIEQHSHSIQGRMQYLEERIDSVIQDKVSRSITAVLASSAASFGQQPPTASLFDTRP
jgi:hypothetical protein